MWRLHHRFNSMCLSQVMDKPMDMIDKFDDYNGKKSGYWTDNKGMLHWVFVATMRKFLSVKIPEVVLNILVIRFSETVLFTVSKIIAQPSVRITM